MRLKIEAPSYAGIVAFIESSIKDILFDDAPTLNDIFITNLFKSFNVPNSKYNAMKSNFTCMIYLLIMMSISFNLT